MARSLHVLLTLLLLLPTAPVLQAEAPPATVVLGANGPFHRTDADGGVTYQILIDDDPEGPIQHWSLNGHTSPCYQGACVPDVEDVRDFGVYAHRWANAPTPTFTLGLYVNTTLHGLERFPLVIVENATDPSALVNAMTALAMEVALPAALNHAPYATNYALPTALAVYWTAYPFGDALYGHPAQYPVGYSTYRDAPTLYVWTMRKHTPAGTLWEGLYVEREGHHSAGDTAHAWKRTVLGTAHRLNGQTEHAAGVYLEEDNRRVLGGDSTHMEQTFTVGLTAAGADAPLAVVHAYDDREGDPGHLWFYPERQTTGYAVGVQGSNGFIPLVGTRTESRNEWNNDTNFLEGIEHTRTTSVGAYVGDRYVPVAGFRYHGDTWPLDIWASRFLYGGGLGARGTGDWEVDAGAFVNGTFHPLAGIHYEDTFADAHYGNTSMLKAGVWAGDQFTPLLGVTYDGEQPFLFWLAAQNTAEGGRWTVSSGTFVGDAYVPLAGAKYAPGAPGGHRQAQETYRVGVFLADYDAFVPLVLLTWDGDRSSWSWVQYAEAAGEPIGDWDASVGTEFQGQPIMLAGAGYRDDTGSSASYQALVLVGVHVPGDGFTPLVGVAYDSNRPPGPSALPTDGGQTTLTAGVYVDGAFTPVAAIPLWV